VRWRIERGDGKPMGIAGLWERSLKDDGLPSWSMTMLTINADNDPVFRRFHKPEDEKRSVVILPDDAWGGLAPVQVRRAGFKDVGAVGA
jgi:putative SOS response-associated peptidase YedK